MHFSGNSGNIFFALSDGAIHKINIDSDTVSEPLVSSVTDFDMYSSDTVVFSAVDGDERIIGTHKDDDKKSKIARTLKGVGPLSRVASSSYFGDEYLALSNGSEIEIIKNPKDSTKVFANFVLKAPVQWLQFSSNGRFVVAQHGAELATYDLEYGTTKHITLAAAQPPTKPAEWLDGYHLWSTYNNQVEMIDFDGSNQQIITDALPGYDVTLSSNGKQLFSIGRNKTTQKPMLQSSRMVIEE
jgi:hypothetical protein